MLVDQNNPILHKPNQPVTQELLVDNGKGLKAVAQVLMDNLHKNNAIGISACQIGIDLALFIINVDGHIRVCANPQLVAASADMEKQIEGCLSFPNLELNINRPTAVVVRYTNLDANEVTEQLDGLAARAWLHEYDHTIGICFTNRVSKLVLDMSKRKLAKAKRRSVQ